jgi:Tn3 transposase DDE domain
VVALAAPLPALETGLSCKRVKVVKVLTARGGWIQVTPFAPLSEPPNLMRLKQDVARRWPMTGLLDMLKEAALRREFTSAFTSVGSRESLDRETLQKRLLLCLYALWTNCRLKAMANVDPGSACSDLRCIRRRYISKEQVRLAIARYGARGGARAQVTQRSLAHGIRS